MNLSYAIRRMRVSNFVIICIGLFVLLGAALLALKEAAFILSAERATGTVTDIIKTSTFQDQQYWIDYCPVVQAKMKEGRSIEFQSSDCTHPAAYKAGQQVPVYINVNKPDASEVEHFQFQFSVPISLALIGLVILAAGLFFSYNAWRVNKDLIDLSNKHRTNGRVAIFLEEGAFEGVRIQFVQEAIR